jgi:23S rRNA pseudouridine2605 synthase
MSKKGFEKFINKEPKASAKKEAFRQEKRKAKADARAAGEEARRKKLDKKRGIITEEPKDKTFGRPSRFKKDDQNLNKTIKPFKAEASTLNKSSETSKLSITKKSDVASSASPINTPTKQFTEQMPLNKFIAHCGVCGRREAAELVKKGVVLVNGDKIFEPSFRVTGNEDIKVKDKKIFLQKNLVYILLNKPKDFITTSKDPEGRKTVLDLIKGATPERVYPVGRLDRNTTGVLLLTNDGELAQKLTHPSYEIKKIYEVKLNKPVTKKDLETIVTGLELEDGFIKADNVAYSDGKDKSVVGIEIHSGRNRIVRRIFEHLGYDVIGLDRVMFANLTKKNVERSRWRMLQEKEVRLLKYMNQSFVKKPKESTAKKVEVSSKPKSTAKQIHKDK